VALHIQRKKLVLEITLIQRFHHVHDDHAGVERAFDLETTISTRIQNRPERICNIHGNACEGAHDLIDPFQLMT
jgi:hypothetical protein